MIEESSFTFLGKLRENNTQNGSKQMKRSIVQYEQMLSHLFQI